MQLSLLIITLSSIILGSSLQKLPENMPFHTKILWGETGIIRKINLAPETRQKELLLRVSSMKGHRILSWLHFAGMASIPFLGHNIHQPDTDYNKALTLHQNVAAATLVIMSISALLTFLPY